MSGVAVAILGFAVMLVLIAVRMPIGLAMFVTGMVGYAYLNGWSAFFAYMKTNAYYQFADYNLSVIPLFILMGAIAEKAGLSTSLFRAARAFVGHWRGGLAIGVVGACTVFGAICGSSVATTATFGRAALPELRRHGYDGGFSAGTVAVGGTLGILVPPSVILVIYGITVEQNIAKLFMAAFVPGLVAALFYILVIMVLCLRYPHLAPAVPRSAWRERLLSLTDVWGVVLVVLVVIGGIYGGIFTPTEGAAVGTVAVLLIGLARHSLPLSALGSALIATAETTAMIFIILLGSEVFNAFLALSRLPNAAADLVAGLGLPPYLVLVALLAFYVVLGAVMDELAMILLTLPIFFPIVMGLKLGLAPDELAIWFGVLVLVVVGIGLVAPPIGLNVFVIAAIARDVGISRIYRGVLPFVVADIGRLALLIAFPGLSLVLVRWLS
jgi:tripartite ATP-independent transporter DctM subunit